MENPFRQQSQMTENPLLPDLRILELSPCFTPMVRPVGVTRPAIIFPVLQFPVMVVLFLPPHIMGICIFLITQGTFSGTTRGLDVTIKWHYPMTAEVDSYSTAEQRIPRVAIPHSILFLMGQFSGKNISLNYLSLLFHLMQKMHFLGPGGITEMT